jgi:hypothetical protein
MARRQRRICLEQGPSLDINLMARVGTIVVGGIALDRWITWGKAPDYVAKANICSDLLGHDGWLQVDMAETCQRIQVVSEWRHFGGYQYYFVCPVTNRKASVLWRPAGAEEFRSRQGWGKRVAYITQIGSWIDRAHRGKEKIKNILLGNENPEDWDLPPKPKWMRKKTYEKYVQRFNHYEDALAQGPDGKFSMSKAK